MSLTRAVAIAHSTPAAYCADAARRTFALDSVGVLTGRWRWRRGRSESARFRFLADLDEDERR